MNESIRLSILENEMSRGNKILSILKVLNVNIQIKVILYLKEESHNNGKD